MSVCIEGKRIDTKLAAGAFNDNYEAEFRLHAAIGSERLRHAIQTAMGIDPGLFVVPMPDPVLVPVERQRDIIRIVRGPRQRIAEIQATVAEYYEVAPIHMTSAQRRKSLSHPRQVAMYLASELTEFSLVNIGRHFGNRDHTTVIHAIKAVKHRAATNPKDFRDVAALREALEG